jgi:hypothetical protein
MYNVKRIGVWKYETKMSRDWAPPPHSEPPPPHLHEVSIEGSVYHQPGTEVDIPVTAGGSQVSGRVYKGEYKREQGESARGKREQGDCAMYIVICICVHNNNRNECCC